MYVILLISTVKFKNVVKILYNFYIFYDFVIVYKHLFLFLFQYRYVYCPGIICRCGLYRKYHCTTMCNIKRITLF